MRLLFSLLLLAMLALPGALIFTASGETISVHGAGLQNITFYVA